MIFKKHISTALISASLLSLLSWASGASLASDPAPDSAAAAFSGAAPKQIKVVQLNAWLLSFLEHHIGEDMDVRERLIPSMITETGADIVALEEVWPTRYKKFIANEFYQEGYHYSAFLHRFLSLGDGLMIVSKFPIVAMQASPVYQEVTRFDEVFTRKRALYAEIEISPTEHIDFFTTHAGALTYDKQTGAYNADQRARQLTQYLQLKDWMRNTRKNQKVILAGDFNGDYLTLKEGHFLQEYSPEYLQLIHDACGPGEDFQNTYLAANNMDQYSKENPTYSQGNPYVSSGYFSEAPSETEDYIFSCGFNKADLVGSEVIFTTPISPSEPSLAGVPPELIPLRISDHYGLTTTFNINE